MESLNMGILFFIITAFSTYACVGTKDRDHGKSMDLVKNNTSKQSAKLADPERSVSPQAAFNWQKAFKGPPTSKERPALQATIKQLTESQSFEDLVKRGRNEFALGLIEVAESSFRRALRMEPKNVDVLLDLASALQRLRRTSEAFDALADARTILSSQESPEESLVFRYRYTLAMTHLANDDRAKAHPILSDLVGKDRTFLPGYGALAFSYLKDGKDSVSNFIVEQALDRGGDHPSLYNILGLLAERQGKVATARSHYNRAIALNDSYAPALVNRGNLYLAANESVMAEADYKRALDADPSNTDALIGLAVSFRKSGRYATAKEKLLRVLDLDGDNPQARFNLAILLRDNLKDEGLALRYYNEVLQSDRASASLKTTAKAAIEEIRNL
jgi:tetratricopeptide (TPR) repeat protein